MLAKAPLAAVLRFGVFELDLAASELRKAGVHLRLQKQPLEILKILLQRAGEIVTRDELRSRIWSADTFVDFDNGLNTSINKLRDVLGDTSSNPRFIETVPRRGYRFIAPVARIEPATADVRPTLRARHWWRWPMIAAAVMVAAIFLLRLTLFYEGSNGSSRISKIRSLAVLPLRSLSVDRQEEYFSDGMTDELITRLAKIRGLRVISHTSVERYKQSRQSLPQIARDLGVDAIVEGTVLRSGDDIRITAQLIDAHSDQHLWAESYQGGARDVLMLQAQVAREIAEQVGINLTAGKQARSSSEQQIDPAAHEAYLKGNFYWDTFTCNGFETALKYYQEASARAPDFAPAYSGLANTYFKLGDWRCWPLETLNQAETAAQRATELDPQLGDAHDALGQLAFYHSWDWDKAEKELSKAIELEPNDAGIHSDYAIFLVAMGKREQALAEMNKALKLDPVSEPTGMTAVYIYYLARQYDMGIAQAKKTLEMFPASYATFHWLGQCYEKKGMPDEAFAAYVQANTGPPEKVSALKTAYKQQGLQGFYATQMEQRRQDKKEIDPVIDAVACTRLGQNEKAIRLLHQAFQQHCDGLQFLKADPVYDPLRGDSRFQQLISQLRF
ncbi:MAG TPA: winged helix-turn-helix domain-containing protein [Terriglobales bacterium]|nr:winged helix-turn-helix domain-containing protein [Terriglobales bacterium]